MVPAERVTHLWHVMVTGFDGTDSARCALRWAADEAAARGCALHVVRVVEPSIPTVTAGWMPVFLGANDLARRELADELVAEVTACRDRNPALEIHAVLHDGEPSACIAEHADQVGADVVVVGGSDRNPLSRLVFGSTEAGLLRTAGRPLVAVRDLTPVQEACVATGYAPVVAAVDDVATSARVLGFAFDAADRWDASVVVVSDVDVADLGLVDLRRQYPLTDVRVETGTRHPARAALAHSADARLAVVADRGLGPVRRAVTGSMCHTLLRHAQCSVAVVG